MAASIPITVFTGFLGAGKTSVILSLLPKLPKDYKIVLLKNEFGDVEVDSKLAKESSLTAVSEILNGCMCCVLVGQMQNALLEIRDNYRPDRIIIECSGSAFPATLAFQIRQLERDTGGDFNLDAIVTVIDAENFVGYEDTSPTARMQASYSDIILINKWEHVSERSLDVVMDHLHTLNDTTPKIKCQARNGVDPGLIFGLQSKLFLSESDSVPVDHDEVETLTLGRAGIIHHHDLGSGDDTTAMDKEKLLQALQLLPRETIWRVKGFVKFEDGKVYILNWAFGRYELKEYSGDDIRFSVRFTVMGSRGEVGRAVTKPKRSNVISFYSTIPMFSYALSTASTYFHLPIDEEEDEDIEKYERKYLTWVAEPSGSSIKRDHTTHSNHDSDGRGAAVVRAVLENDDLYDILGVAKSATLDKMTLRRAYLSRSRACHPDKFPDNPDATHAFQKVAVAYDVLSKPSLKRLYDNRSPSSNFDVFATRPMGHAEDTFRGVVLGAFNDFLDGDLEVIRTLLKAINDINPSIKLGEDGINSVLVTLQAIRERALTCRTCIYALHTEVSRLLEVQNAFRELSYFDLMGRSRLTIQLTRITLSLPIALEKALQDQQAFEYDDDGNEKAKERIFPRQVTLLIKGVDIALARMEKILK
ncbi:hypothetical protein CVT25_013949 [Psilocybe cyanescens]|uniref:J domain-containing protein n=1 Tax=Psilocybe cyanescens TaxID=93625 RepID=A0A409XJU6_PSICY|nr:hypothetical protein CVT25_013949 [Psilocybe cyanescens]